LTQEIPVKPIRVGVIGLGLIWIRERQSSLAPLKSLFEPVAFCDVSEQRRAETEACFPGRPVVDDYRQILAMPDVAILEGSIKLNSPVTIPSMIVSM
jgi:predicted dehydrogenase